MRVLHIGEQPFVLDPRPRVGSANVEMHVVDAGGAWHGLHRDDVGGVHADIAVAHH